MAKEALTWEHSFSPCETRETKVVRLLRTGGAPWGVTEARSAFVYPRSLRPLRKIAGAEADDGEGADTDGEGPTALDATRLLAEVFPEQVRRRKDGDNNNNNDDDDETKEGNKINNDAAAAPAAAEDATSTGPPNGRRGDQPRAADNRVAAGGRTRRNRRGVKEGRPVFYLYGNGNTAPSSGGVVYGGYMLSHSINPQVLPNRPPTRQVHSGTQRVAVRAAARGKAAGTMSAGSAAPGNTRMGNARPNARAKLATTKTGGAAKRSVCAGDGAVSRWTRGGADDKAAVVRAGETGSHSGSDATVFDPVTLFSALPDDPEPWGPGTTRHTSASAGSARKCSTRRPSTAPDGRGTLPPSPPPDAAVTQGHVDADEIAASGGAVEPLSGSGQHTLRHTWTSNQRLANDPRNYKFLPRGWAGEFIVPAGIPGEQPPSSDAHAPERERWLRKGKGTWSTRSAARKGVDGCGVGDCLRWTSGS